MDITISDMHGLKHAFWISQDVIEILYIDTCTWDRGSETGPRRGTYALYDFFLRTGN